METVAGVVAGLLATVVVLLLLLVQPRRGRDRYEQLKVEVRTDPSARLRFYRVSIIGAWLMAAIVVGIGALASLAGHSVGLPPASSRLARGSAWLAAAELAVVLPLSLLILRSKRPKVQRLVQRQLRIVGALLPVTAEERKRFVAVAITAGICEEIVFRWFGITYVRWLAPGSSDAAVIVVIAVAFGLAHWYQGRWGVLGTGAAGALFTWLTLSSGSLLPAILVHALLDLRIVGLRPLPPEPDGMAPAAA